MPTTFLNGWHSVFEAISGCVPVIETDHVHVHAGDSYTVSHSLESVANNATLILELTTPANRSVHIKEILVWAGGSENTYQTGGMHTSSGGTSKAPWNRNRQSTKTSTVVCLCNPVVTGGINMEEIWFGGGGGVGSGIAGNQNMKNEWVLKTGTKYFLRLTNKSGLTKPMSIVITWYEVEI